MSPRLLREVISEVKTGLTLTFFIVALAEIVIQYEVLTNLISPSFWRNLLQVGHL